jgi:hypothetical protein
VTKERDNLRARIASAMACRPDDDADLVEAVRLLVQERDAAVQRAERAEHLHAEAEADLARLSVRLVEAERARDHAQTMQQMAEAFHDVAIKERDLARAEAARLRPGCGRAWEGAP